MKIYIAGKITGDPDYKKKFEKAAWLMKVRYGGDIVIINPADHPEGLSAAEYMRLCFAEIDMADVVAFLQDWMESGGARLEEHYCKYIGKPRVYIALVNGKHRYFSIPYMGEVKA